MAYVAAHDGNRSIGKWVPQSANAGNPQLRAASKSNGPSTRKAARAPTTCSRPSTGFVTGQRQVFIGELLTEWSWKPVLLLAGEYYVGLLPRNSAEHAGLFAHAELAVQPGAGHFPWLDDPA